jgi:hypothetical protein
LRLTIGEPWLRGALVAVVLFSGSSDYVLMISAGASRYSFILLAALLVVADTLGVAIGVMAALAWRRPA